MQIIDLISATRDGREVTRQDLYDFTSSVASGEIPDYQVSAWLMAAYLKGLSTAETISLTLAMRDSGKVLQWEDGLPLADKHSTGGVGDKISLVLAPLAAAAGLRIPMISGRSLGHTGGTLDKLESIPGMNVNIQIGRFMKLVEENGVAMTGQSEDLAPADRRLYALRDATATVTSIPLICASILSKKLAENTDILVFDIKIGNGAFMKTEEQGTELALALIDIAKEAGVRVEAFLTGMDLPLGLKTGNALEVQEALEVLRGEGPQDIRELSIRLVASMLLQANPEKYSELADAVEYCGRILDNGNAFARFILMVEAQGGDISAFELLPEAPVIFEIAAGRSGFWNGVDALVLGEVVRGLGGGRYSIDQKINPSVGWEQIIPGGIDIRNGEAIGLIHAEDQESAYDASISIIEAFIWDQPVQPLIRKVI
ncbi:MAG: thymidine phosphorylase [Candidatus Aegiribacteria sp.]|nr:thymidine phosphorylase [Candidatus Aegiribacteria sp.]